MKKVTWLVMASSTAAMVYDLTQDAEVLHYEPLKVFHHEASREKSGDLTSDRSGRYGQGRFTPAADAHAQEHHLFAEEIAHFLNQKRMSQDYEALVICAEPRFAGLINQVLNKQVADKIIKNIHKDYLSFSESERQQKIQDIIQSL